MVNARSDMRVVAEASNGAEAAEQYRKHRPDVMLLDIRLPAVDGLTVLRSLREEFPDCRALVLTSVGGDILALRAFESGAAGYLLKDTVRTELVKAIRCVHEGEKWLPPEIAQLIARHRLDDALSGREIEVLQDLAAGFSNKRVAEHLGLTEGTVKNHVKSILSKLGAADRTHAVVIGTKRGYVQL